ncbi:hypothetical protein [Ectothiorhodospira mobilis]|uniref:defense against restriction DarA-related protein n=1 Tax=Ectothiorhodospira mobilis TaxID=195064 RepID=UPI001908A52E|nr:hypothetical protein [Ectothiorhodospira mobilis]MBK1691068.1 hypothetical protein [Ectothiorhodospira mobilis]
MPVGMSLDQLLYRIRRSDADDGLIFDSVTLDDILEEAEAVFELDALVATQSSLGRKVRSLERVMSAGGGELEVVASQVSSPFKRQGVVNVAAIFELSDGQTVTVMFHNPDAGTAKSLKPTDELISWKWLLNKKDITIVVAPERGSDLPIRQVAKRIMKLAEKNSKTFARMNQKRAERLEYIEGLKGEIGELETELDGLTRQIEIARIEAEDKALNTPKPLTKQEGLDLLNELRPWLSRQQYRAMADVIRKGEESEAYIDRAQALANIIDGMAKTYEQDGKEMDETTAYLHYFRGGGDWYITEKDAMGDGTEQAFGWADPGLGHGELGYIGVDELTGAGVELDLYFEPKPLSQAVESQTASQDDEGAEPAPDIPDNVRERLNALLAPLVGIAEGLSSARETDYRMGGGGRYAGEYMSGRRDDLAAAEAAIEERLASIPDEEKREAARAYIDTRRPDLSLSEAEQEWADSVGSAPEEDAAARREAAEATIAGWKASLAAGDAPSQIDAEAWAAFQKAYPIQAAAVKNTLSEQIGWERFVELAEGEPPAEPTGKDTATGVNEEGELEPEGAENVVKTAKGSEVQTGFTVVEAEELIASHDINGDPNPAFPTELQPRDRGRDASIAWVKKTARQLDPDSLGRTRRADTGAPIVGPDRVVESGNGRTMAIQEAYRSGNADEYREWLIEEAHHYNLDAGRVRAMKAPVLVRVRTSALDRREFAVEANQDDKLSMTGTEKARADADRLDEGLVAKLADDGNLLAASNRDFIMGFLQSLGDTEAAQYMTSDGNPTGALIARVQAAIFAKAYNDDRLLEMTADASKPEVANVVNALNVAAPEFIRAQAADQAGTDALTNQLVDSVETSLNEQAVQAIIDATNLVRRAKADGSSVEEAVNQMGLFGDIPPATAAMALFINQNNRSAKRLGLAFRAMAAFVRQEAERGQTVDMFGDSQRASLEQIIEAVNRELEKEYGEGSYAIESLDMFEAPPAAPDGDTDPTESAGQGGVRLYHGTAKGNAFSRFDASRAGRGVGKNHADQGDQIYLTASRQAAEWFAEKAEVAKQLENGGNPGANEDNSGTVLAFTLDASAQVLHKLSMPRGSQSQEVIQQARDQGFDAIAFPDQGFGTVEGDPRVGEMYTDGAPPTTYIILDESKLTPEGEVGRAPDEDDLEQARQSTDTDPSEAEKESGDYAKGEVEIHGLTVAIENPKGSERSGTTQDGEAWSVFMANDYGYIKGAKGADGDEVDVFIGPDLESERVFVINQVGKDGELDEHKVMLGFATREDAEQGYLSSYRAGWDGLGSTQEMSIDELKVWLPSASEGKPAAAAEEPAEEAPAADPLEQARAVTQRDEFASLTRDFTRSLATIKGIDAGTMPGMERSLFVNSITGKIKTRAKRDPLLGAVLLAWLAEQQKDWGKPAITPRNAVWKAADDWEVYRSLFNRDAAPSDGQEAGDGEGAPAPEPAAPESEEEAMRRNDRQFLQSVIDGTVPDMLSPDLADRILAVMERQSGDDEMEDLIERAGAAYERAMLSATEDL